MALLRIAVVPLFVLTFSCTEKQTTYVTLERGFFSGTGSCVFDYKLSYPQRGRTGPDLSAAIVVPDVDTMINAGDFVNVAIKLSAYLGVDDYRYGETGQTITTYSFAPDQPTSIRLYNAFYVKAPIFDRNIYHFTVATVSQSGQNIYWYLHPGLNAIPTKKVFDPETETFSERSFDAIVTNYKNGSTQKYILSDGTLADNRQQGNSTMVFSINGFWDVSNAILNF